MENCLCVLRFCTSIVAQDKNGTVYHGRNLDYPHPALRNMTLNAVFLRKGKVQCKKKLKKMLFSRKNNIICLQMHFLCVSDCRWYTREPHLLATLVYGQHRVLINLPSLETSEVKSVFTKKFLLGFTL